MIDDAVRVVEPDTFDLLAVHIQTMERRAENEEVRDLAHLVGRVTSLLADMHRDDPPHK